MALSSVDSSADTSVIQALIITRGREGASLKELKEDYKKEVGKTLSFGTTDYELRRWLEDIAHVKTAYRNGLIVYFSDAPNQQHLTSMIYKQRKQRVAKSSSSSRSSSIASKLDETLCTPKSWTNSLTFRRRKFSNSSFIHEKQSVPDSVFKRPKTPAMKPARMPKRPLVLDSSQSISSKRSKPSYLGQSDGSKAESDRYYYNSSFSSLNFTVVSNQLSVDEHMDPYLPEYYKCTVFGDNFFLNLAVKDMGFRMRRVDDVLQSGYCISGQTIKEAIENIENMLPNQIILLNVGSVDIMQGKELVELIFGMFQLLRACVDNAVTPIITTIVPLANYRLGNRVAVTNGLNDFLMRNPFKFPVIPLHKAFLNRDGAMEAACYQQSTRFVSGTRKPIVFWSRLGHQRAMNFITKELGNAILKIIISEKKNL